MSERSNPGLVSLHDLRTVNTVINMLYDENGKYRAGFKPEEFYNTILLDTLKFGEENYVHLKYAETINIRKGETTAKFRRWAGMTPTLRPMKEGVPPAPDKHAYEIMEVGNVFSFGRWSVYTDKVDQSVVSEIVSERSVQYGENAAQTKELYARKTWLSAPNQYFANFKSGIDKILFGDEIILDDLRFLIARMKRMQVKPIGGKFNYICSPEFINGLIDDPRVKQYMAIEQTTGKLWSTGEPFDLFELSFIPTMLDEFAYPDTEFPGVYVDTEGKEVIRLYAMDGNTVYYLDVHQDFITHTDSNNKAITAKKFVSGTSYLNDGTAVEDKIEWEVPTNMVTLSASNVVGYNSVAEANKVRCFKSTISITTSTGTYDYGTRKVTYGAPTDLAEYDAINSLLQAGAFIQLPIHRGILFGDEALLKINVEGLTDAPRIIIKALGSSGVADPLDQRQSIGYRVDGFGLAIKRPEAICITFCIPKNAAFAALTARYINGDPTLLDMAHPDDDSYANYMLEDGTQALRVDSINDPSSVVTNVGQPTINGTNDFPILKSLYVAGKAGDVFQHNGFVYAYIKDFVKTTFDTEVANARKASAVTFAVSTAYAVGTVLKDADTATKWAYVTKPISAAAYATGKTLADVVTDGNATETLTTDAGKEANIEYLLANGYVIKLRATQFTNLLDKANSKKSNVK